MLPPVQAPQVRSHWALGTPGVTPLAIPTSSSSRGVVAATGGSGIGTVFGAALAGWAFSSRRSRGTQNKRRGPCVEAAESDSVGPGTVGVVLLSAGVGKRVGAGIPKQYIKLLGLEIALHSLESFLDCDVAEIVIVCAEEWRYIFSDHLKQRAVRPTIRFAAGGAERQDSVCNGLAELTTEFAAVHDAARPLVTRDEIDRVIEDARKFGTALLAVPPKATIKMAHLNEDSDALVSFTPDRKTLWEALTPQVVPCELLRQGFANADENDLVVTDDVSLVEHMGKPVKLTQGEYTNIKVTTPEDLVIAETILRSRGFVDRGSA